MNVKNRLGRTRNNGGGEMTFVATGKNKCRSKYSSEDCRSNTACTSVWVRMEPTPGGTRARTGAQINSRLSSIVTGRMSRPWILKWDTG